MDHQAKLVSLLFYSAEPITTAQILKTFRIDKTELKKLQHSAKTTKKVTPLMTCTVCKKKYNKKGVRIKK